MAGMNKLCRYFTTRFLGLQPSGTVVYFQKFRDSRHNPTRFSLSIPPGLAEGGDIQGDRDH
jgi:hypothetical protein